MKKFLLLLLSLLVLTPRLHADAYGSFVAPNNGIMDAYFSFNPTGVNGDAKNGTVTAYTKGSSTPTNKINRYTSNITKLVMKPDPSVCDETFTLTLDGDGISFIAEAAYRYIRILGGQNMTISSANGTNISSVEFDLQGYGDKIVNNKSYFENNLKVNAAGKIIWNTNGEIATYVFDTPQTTATFEIPSGLGYLNLYYSFRFNCVAPLAAPKVDMAYADELIVAGYPKLVGEEGNQEFQYLSKRISC